VAIGYRYAFIASVSAQVLALFKRSYVVVSGGEVLLTAIVVPIEEVLIGRVVTIETNRWFAIAYPSP